MKQHFSKAGCILSVFILALMTICFSSCSALTLNIKSSKISVTLPGASGSRSAFGPEAINRYYIGINSDSTGDQVFTKEAASGETIETELQEGSYSVIIFAIGESQEENGELIPPPMGFGKQSKIEVVPAETTPVTVKIVPLNLEPGEAETFSMPENASWTYAELPALSQNVYIFTGWLTAENTPITEFPDTTDLDELTLVAGWVPRVTITYVSENGTVPASKEVNAGYRLTVADLPDLGETGDKYFDHWDTEIGTEITEDTTITASWDTIVYLKNFKDITDISSVKTTIEKIVFTKDTYTGNLADTIGCADKENNPGYFTGVFTEGTAEGKSVLTIYGNGHRIYAPDDCSKLFNSYTVLTDIDFTNFYTSRTTNMSYMFGSCSVLTSLNISSFNTSSVTDMNYMFYCCSTLKSLDVLNFDTSSVINMSGMFSNCTKIVQLNLSSFDTSSVTNMSGMFSNCTKLEELHFSSGFDTSSVTNMNTMFQACSSFSSLDVSNFDTSNVTTMSSMFANCGKLEQIDLSSLNTSKVSNIASMFMNCYNLKSVDLSSFSADGMTTASDLFARCRKLVTIYVSSGFDLSDKPGSTTFDDDVCLVGGKGTAYSDCAVSDSENCKKAIYARPDGGPTSDTPGYFTVKQ